jgi:hypothetical protein
MLPETPTGGRPVSLHDADARHGRHLLASRIVSWASARRRARRQHPQLRPLRPPSEAGARNARARRGSAALQYRAPCWSGSNPHTTRAPRRRAQRVRRSAMGEHQVRLHPRGRQACRCCAAHNPPHRTPTRGSTTVSARQWARPDLCEGSCVWRMQGKAPILRWGSNIL